MRINYVPSQRHDQPAFLKFFHQRRVLGHFTKVFPVFVLTKHTHRLLFSMPEFPQSIQTQLMLAMLSVISQSSKNPQHRTFAIVILRSNTFWATKQNNPQVEKNPNFSGITAKTANGRDTQRSCSFIANPKSATITEVTNAASQSALFSCRQIGTFLICKLWQATGSNQQV